MVRLPSLPDPDNILSVFDKASNAIDRGLSFIDKVGNKLDQFGLTEKSSTQQTIPAKGKGATDQQTLAYQLEHLTKALRALEIHLSEGCEIGIQNPERPTD